MVPAGRMRGGTSFRALGAEPRCPAGHLSPFTAGLSRMKSTPSPSRASPEPPLPRSTGERKRRPQGLVPFLYPHRGEYGGKAAGGGAAKRRRSGVAAPYAIALPYTGRETLSLVISPIANVAGWRNISGRPDRGGRRRVRAAGFSLPQAIDQATPAPSRNQKPAMAIATEAKTG